VQIKITGQPAPVSKVETDRTEEVKKIKPIGINQIPDSFDAAAGCYAAETETEATPVKKVGQITGAILLNQITLARLGDGGIKLVKPNEKEDNKEEPKLIIDKNKEAIKNSFAQQNGNLPSSGHYTQGSGSDVSQFGVGQGVNPGGAFNGSQPGPNNPIDAVNDKLAAMDYAQGIDDQFKVPLRFGERPETRKNSGENHIDPDAMDDRGCR
jgi:hypothetical protein